MNEEEPISNRHNGQRARLLRIATLRGTGPVPTCFEAPLPQNMPPREYYPHKNAEKMAYTIVYVVFFV